MIRDRHIEFKLKKNQRVIRMVAIKKYKNFLAKPEGKLRLGLMTRPKSCASKKIQGGTFNGTRISIFFSLG